MIVKKVEGPNKWIFLVRQGPRGSYLGGRPCIVSTKMNCSLECDVQEFTPIWLCSRRGHSSHPLDFGRKFVVRSNGPSFLWGTTAGDIWKLCGHFLLPALEFPEFSEFLDATCFLILFSRDRSRIRIQNTHMDSWLLFVAASFTATPTINPPRYASFSLPWKLDALQTICSATFAPFLSCSFFLFLFFYDDAMRETTTQGQRPPRQRHVDNTTPHQTTQPTTTRDTRRDTATHNKKKDTHVHAHVHVSVCVYVHVGVTFCSILKKKNAVWNTYLPWCVLSHAFDLPQWLNVPFLIQMQTWQTTQPENCKS